MALAAHFGQPQGADKLASIAWRVGRTGAPVLVNARAYFDCSLYGHHPASDHELVLGRVVDGAILSPDAAPLDYASAGGIDGSERLFPDTL